MAADIVLLMGHGTDALRIGLAALFDHDGFDYGGEVIVPALLPFIASAAAALDRRFGVAFVAAVNPATLLLDPRASKKPSSLAKLAHYAGLFVRQPADMTALKAIADKHGLKIIEDAAQADGAAGNRSRSVARPCGRLQLFQSSKNLASGEGGALVTNDEQVYEQAFSMHNAGRYGSDESRWEHAKRVETVA